MTNGRKIVYSDEEIAEFNSFQNWWNSLDFATRAALKGEMGWGLFKPNPDKIGEYKDSNPYKEWKNKAGGGTGVTTTTEAKAAQYAVDQQTWKSYQAQGGDMDFTTWLRSDKPAPGEKAGGVGAGGIESLIKEKGEFVNLEEHMGYLVPRYKRSDGSDYLLWEEAVRSTKTEAEPTGYQQGQLDLSRAQLDEEIRQFNTQMAQLGQMSDYEKQMMELNRQQLNESIRQFNLQTQLGQQQLQQQESMQQEMIDWYREQQAGELEAQKQQRLAQLRANPASWLEYASLSGEQPAVQPWMVPLSPGDYNLQAGQKLPGWTAEGESLKSLPELTKPSAQYAARIAPSARQQYYGYEQARTGATPEDVEWKMWSQAPPGRAGGGLRYVR